MSFNMYHVCNIAQPRQNRTTTITRWGLQGPKFCKPRVRSQKCFSVAPSHQAIVACTCVILLRNMRQTTFMWLAGGQRVGRHFFLLTRRPGHNFGFRIWRNCNQQIITLSFRGSVIKKRSPDEAVFGVLCLSPSAQPSTLVT